MKSSPLALFIFAFLLISIVSEADCFETYPLRKRSKPMIKMSEVTDRRSLCEAARNLNCDRELQDEPKAWDDDI